MIEEIVCLFIILCSILWCRNIDGDLDDDGDDGVTTTLEAVVTTIHIMFITAFVIIIRSTRTQCQKIPITIQYSVSVG